MRSIYIILVILTFVLCSCRSILSNCKDITNDPCMKYVKGQCLELKQDVFLYQYADTKVYSLGLPGYFSSLPTSIDEYQQDPLNWGNTDSNAKKGCGIAQNYLKHKIIDVIPAGTKLQVVQVRERNNLYDSVIDVISYLDHPMYNSLEVDIYFLLKKSHGEIDIPYPSEPELTIMGRKKILYSKPGVLEYCDEPFLTPN